MKKEVNFSKGKRGQFFSNNACFNLPIDSDKKIQIEKLSEGVYLATSDDIPGLVAQGKTITETVGIARDVAKKLLSTRT